MIMVIDMERLQKVIANSGYCSRRKAEELILKGKVIVNDEVVTELGVKVGPKDDILVDGNAIEKEQKEYILLYKPRGVVSTTSDEHKRKTVVELIQTTNRIYPIGRLDYDTTGLLLLTNDGEFANLVMHPKNKIEKVYVAKINGILNAPAISKLKNGVVIDGEKTAPAKLKILDFDKSKEQSIVQLTIFEGKNHQVKKMFEAVGFTVLKLKRESIAFLTLDGLTPGEYRRLNPKEVKKLYNDATN